MIVEAEPQLLVLHLVGALLLPLQPSDRMAPARSKHHVQPLAIRPVAMQLQPWQIKHFMGVSLRLAMCHATLDDSLAGAVVQIHLIVMFAIVTQHLRNANQLVAPIPGQRLTRRQCLEIATLVEAVAQARRLCALAGNHAVIAVFAHLHPLGITAAGAGHMAHLRQVTGRVVGIVAGVVAPEIVVCGAERDSPRQCGCASIARVFTTGGLDQSRQAVVFECAYCLHLHVAGPAGRLRRIADAQHIADPVVAVEEVLQSLACRILEVGAQACQTSIGVRILGNAEHAITQAFAQHLARGVDAALIHQGLARSAFEQDLAFRQLAVDTVLRLLAIAARVDLLQALPQRIVLPGGGEGLGLQLCIPLTHGQRPVGRGVRRAQAPGLLGDVALHVVALNEQRACRVIVTNHAPTAIARRLRGRHARVTHALDTAFSRRLLRALEYRDGAQQRVVFEPLARASTVPLLHDLAATAEQARLTARIHAVGAQHLPAQAITMRQIGPHVGIGSVQLEQPGVPLLLQQAASVEHLPRDLRAG